MTKPESGTQHLTPEHWGANAIHMIMLVLFSSLAGIMLREWQGCRPRTWSSLGSALLVLLFAVLAIAYGNYLGDAMISH